MNNNQSVRLFFSLLIFTLPLHLASCGGGGGDTAATPSASSNVEQATSATQSADTTAETTDTEDTVTASTSTGTSTDTTDTVATSAGKGWSVIPDNGFSGTTSSNNAFLLSDGNLLILASTEGGLYHPSTNGWTATAAPPSSCTGFSRTGSADEFLCFATANAFGGPYANGAWRYIAATDAWTSTGLFHATRYAPNVASLSGGKLLATTGIAGNMPNALTAELYDPATGKWTYTGSFAVIRSNAASRMQALNDGRVLLIGGIAADYSSTLADVELYDPATGTWSRTGSLSWPRGSFETALLADGRVMVAGGLHAATDYTTSLGYTDKVEIYDPATAKWTSAAPMSKPRYDFQLLTMKDDTVMAVGGSYQHLRFLQSGLGITTDVSSPYNPPFADAELYDPATDKWTAIEPMNTARSGHYAAVLSDGRLIAGGGTDRSAELYTP